MASARWAWAQPQHGEVDYKTPSVSSPLPCLSLEASFCTGAKRLTHGSTPPWVSDEYRLTPAHRNSGFTNWRRDRVRPHSDGSLSVAELVCPQSACVLVAYL